MDGWMDTSHGHGGAGTHHNITGGPVGGFTQNSPRMGCLSITRHLTHILTLVHNQGQNQFTYWHFLGDWRRPEIPEETYMCCTCSPLCCTYLCIHCIMFLQIFLSIFGLTHLLNIFPLIPDFLDSL